ncbi:MAG: amidohydrolase family protein [Cyanobacteria bacterium P01_D01_bin.123]
MSSLAARPLLVGKLLAAPGEKPAAGPVEIAFKKGFIESISPVAAISDELTDEQRGLLAMPALANAHDHGRGLSTFAFGAGDRPLELWLPALKLQPALPVYALTALALAGMARSGVGAVVHCHNPSGGDALEEAQAVCQAARDVGVRLALALPLCDRNALAYGNSEHLLSLMAPGDREQVRATWDPPTLSPAAQVERVEAIASVCEGDLIHVQYCPRGPQWCSNTLLEQIAAASAETGRRIHTHVFETRYQREWADAHYPQGLFRYLDDIGFLSPRLTIAHGIWLRADELELLAERGVTVSVNTSSNLRLRSGLASYRAMLDAGIPVAFGLDGMSLNDRDDAFEELRLNYHLYASPSLNGNRLSLAEVFAAHRHGVVAVCDRRDGGVLEPGQPADFTLLDYGAMTRDVVEGACSPAEIILARGSRNYLKALWVAGKPVVDRGQVLGIDESSLQEEIGDKLRSQSRHVYSLQALVGRYQQVLEQFYSAGLHTTLE